MRTTLGNRRKSAACHWVCRGRCGLKIQINLTLVAINLRLMTSQAIKKIAIVLSAIAVVLVLVPFEPSFPGHHLDWSWAYAMNVAVAKGLQFGRDIVFTYGPLASVSTGLYHPATDAITIVGRLILSASLFMVFWGACDRRLLLWLLALPLVLSKRFGLDAIFMLLPPMFLLFCVRNTSGAKAEAATILLSAAAFGITPLIKGSFTPAIAICGAASLLIIWRKSRALAFGAVAVFVGTLLLGWVSSNQSLSGLLNYFVAQLPIISGYSDAMSYGGPVNEVAVFVATASILLIALWRSEVKIPWFAMGAVALILFLAFKAGFSRHDAHAIGAGYALLLFGFYIVLWAPSRLSFAALVAASGAWIFILSGYAEVRPATIAANFVESLSSSIRGIHARTVSRAVFDEKLKLANDQIRAAIPLPKTDGTADAYPIDLAAIFASHIDWKPRPVLQSYSAYTPGLAEMNAQHLAASGPDRVFFRTSAIDGRYPNIEDGPSWVPLLERYRATGFSGDFTLLDRQVAPDRVAEVPIATIDSNLGETISLKGMEGPIFVRIEMRPKLSGKLLNLAFRSPELRIGLMYANGEKADYRYVAGMGPTGFLLSPTITTKEQFVALKSTMREDYFQSGMVASFRIYEAELPGVAWKSRIKVKLSRLSIPSDESADSLLYAAPTKSLASLEGFKRASDCVVDRANGVGPEAPFIPRHGGSFRLNGWGLVSGKDGVQSDSFSLAFLDADGTALVYPLKKVARPDVAAHFGRPETVMVGFEGVLNIKQIVGTREIRLLLARGADQYVCDKNLHLAAGGMN